MNRSLFRNAFANFGGALLPAVAMLALLPVIVRELGTVQFGVFTMVMAITGYFAVIDVNVTAGTTKYVSEFLARGEAGRAAEVVTFGLGFYAVIGALGGIAIFAAAPLIVDGLIRAPVEERPIIVACIQIAGAGFFLAQIQVYLNSVLQALHRFDLTARCEIAFGIAIPVGSVVVLKLGGGLMGLIAIRVLASAAHGVLLALLAARLLPSPSLRAPSRETRSLLWTFSGYAYLSRIASVTYTQADKIIVGGVLGMVALSYYSVAAQLVNRVTSLTFRLSAVMFPAASALEAKGEMPRLRGLYMRSTRYITFVNAMACGLICLFGREILHYWMGPEFARYGYAVLVFITVACLIDSLTTLPSLINDALGFPKYTGFFSIARVATSATLLFVIALLTNDLGSTALAHTSASFTWAFAFLLFVHGRSLPWRLGDIVGDGWGPAMLVVFVIAVLIAIRPAETLGVFSAVGGILIIGVLGAAAFVYVLAKDDRQALLGLVAGLRSGVGRSNNDV